MHLSTLLSQVVVLVLALLLETAMIGQLCTEDSFLPFKMASWPTKASAMCTCT